MTTLQSEDEMSDDLITRLRGYKKTPKYAEDLCFEAADHITKLEKQFDALRNAINYLLSALQETHACKKDLGARELKESK